MTSFSGKLTLRPTRIGFLVRPSDTSSIRRIMRLNTCLWGGVYNPIIPVCNRTPSIWADRVPKRSTGISLTDGYLDFFEPDVYVESEAGLADQIGIIHKYDSHSFRRVVQLEKFYTADSNAISLPTGSNIFEVYRYLYQKEFKFHAKREQNIFVIEGRSAQLAFLEATVGVFPKSERFSYLRKAYGDIFSSASLPPEPEGILPYLYSESLFPFSFTKYQTGIENRGSRDTHVYIFDPSNPYDLIDYWNLRLFKDNIVPINIHWMDHSIEYLRSTVLDNHEHHKKTGRVEFPTTIEFSSSLEGTDKLKNIKAECADLPKGSYAWKMWYDQIWRKPNSPIIHWPKRFIVTSKKKDLELRIETEGERHVKFNSLDPPFVDDYSGESARWVNILSMAAYSLHEDIAFLEPSTIKEHEYLNTRIADQMLRSCEGFVLPQSHRHNSEYLKIDTGSESIIRWFDLCGIKASKSDPGHIADQIIKSLGGLFRSYILGHADTLQLLDKMSKSIRRTSTDTEEEYSDRTSPVSVWKGLLHKRKNKARWRAPVLDDFINSGILKLGIELKCPICQKQNWYSLKNLNEMNTCDRCLNEFPFPQGSLDFRNSPWKYRVVGPFSVPDFAGGGYSTVLSIACFAKRLGGMELHATYSTNLDLIIADEQIEIDYALWYGKQGWWDLADKPCLVIGEAKSYADEAITQKDIDRLKTIAQKLPGTYLAFSVLKTSLSAPEKARLIKLVKWGNKRLPDGSLRAPVIVLTGTELFSSHSVMSSWEEKGGLQKELMEKAYNRLSELPLLAELTQEVYLGLKVH